MKMFYMHYSLKIISRPGLKVHIQKIKMRLQMPTGFRFDPTDEELIAHYLRKKVFGEQLPSDAVIEGEVYGGRGVQLPEIGELYIFVKRKKYQRGKKTIRLARNGYWKVTGNKKKIVDESGKHIGTRRSLVFKEKSNSGTRKNLLMDEYSLHMTSTNQTSLEEWVLCRIKQSNRSPDRSLISTQEEGDEHDIMSNIDMDDIWKQIDNNPIEQFHAETSAGPSHLVPYDQSPMAMNTPASTPTAAPALVGSDDIINEYFYNESFFREWLDLLYEVQP